MSLHLDILTGIGHTFYMENRWYKSGGALLDEIREARSIDHGALIWFLGQHGFVVKINGVTVYIDALLNDFTSPMGVHRAFPAPFAPADVRADYFLCTHGHDDHMNPDTILPLAKADGHIRFAAPAPLVSALTGLGLPPDRVIGAREGETIVLQGGTGEAELIPLAAAHTEYETDTAGDNFCLGYIVRGGGVSVYHSGDTLVTPRLVDTLKKLGPVDVALLPINGGDWYRAAAGLIPNMNAEDAVKLGREIGADLIIPAHYDMMCDNDTDPAVFAALMYKFCPSKKYHLCAPGEKFVYQK